MKRNLQKAIHDFEKMATKNNTCKHGIYLSDINQIHELAEGSPVLSILMALEAGYMIGYRTAKRERKA